MKRIKSVTVTKLFGYEGNDYSVELDSTSPINFVYAFNGVGKTTLFKLIYAAIKIQITILDSIIFETLRITFDNGEILSVRKTINKHFDDITIGEFQKDETGKYYFPIVYELEIPNDEILKGKLYFKNISKLFKEQNERHFFEIIKNGSAYLKTFYSAPYVDDFSDFDEKMRTIYAKLIEVKNLEILFANRDYNRTITEQRIRSKKDNGIHIESIFDNYETRDTIPLKFKDIKKLVDERQLEIWEDRDLGWNDFLDITRNSENYDKLEKMILFEIPDKTKKMTDYFKYFATNQFILDHQTQITPKKQYNENTVWEIPEIRERLFSTFETIINEKSGLKDKIIHIKRNTGDIEITVNSTEKKLPIESLSSGEKNLLLLYFYLIFSIGDNSILLIDEPEVSLHVDWQQQLASNIMEICKDRNIQILIATHSPDIINDYFLLMSEMKKRG